jgi:hypothetical protein
MVADSGRRIAVIKGTGRLRAAQELPLNLKE